MNSQEYIISELYAFIKIFPMVRVRYEYDEHAVVHTIEVIPNEIYRLNEDFISWECEMFDKFVERYPYENICFITDDALVGIDHVDFELCGEKFIQVSAEKAKTVGREFIATQGERLVNKFMVLNIYCDKKYDHYVCPITYDRNYTSPQWKIHLNY
jgi:hypothetical protein